MTSRTIPRHKGVEDTGNAETNPLKPLAGRTVVVTRAADQASDLTERLEKLGARVLLVPAVSFSEPDDWGPADHAIKAVREFDWVLFTSANAARFFAARCRKMGVNPGIMKKPRYAAVGAATAEAAAAEGFMISYTARTSLGEALARELAPSLAGKRVLLPRSDRAARDLPDALAEAGALVTEVIAYKTGGMGGAHGDVLGLMKRGEFDVMTFFSPSAVENLRNELGAESFSQLAKNKAFAAIGPVTTAALRRHGVLPPIEPRQATADSMALAISEYFQRRAKRQARS